MTRRALFWPAFLLLAALYVFGFRESRLFSQTVWRPLGVTRIRRFAARCAVGFAAGVLLFPAWLTRLTAVGAVIHAGVTVGAQPVGAVLLFLASCWAVGSAMATGVYAMLAGAGIYALLFGGLVHLPVNYAAVYLALFLLPLVWQWRRVRAGLTGLMEWFRHPEAANRADAAAAGLLAAILLMHLLVVLKPEASSDGLAVHLTVPASIAIHHQWTLDFRHTTWVMMPLTADWIYTAVYLPGGAAAARLVNFAMLLAGLAVLYELLRRRLSVPASILFCGLFASSPIVQLVTGSLFVENFWMAMLVGGLALVLRYRESGASSEAFTAALLLGTGIASKYAAASFAIPAAVLLVIAMRRQRAARLAPAVLLLMVVFAAPPYVRAYWATGNPVYPFANTFFQSPYFDQKEKFSDIRYRTPLSGRSLYDATFHTSKFLEGHNGGWGFPYLFFLPLAVLMLSRKTSYGEGAALGIALFYSIATFSGQSNIRYLYPALPLFLVAAGGAAAAVREDGRARYGAMLAAGWVLLALNTYFLPASGWYHQEFDRTSQDPAPVQKLVAYLNREHYGQPVMFLESQQIAGLAGKAYTASWHNQEFWARLWDLDSARSCLELMKKTGLSLFIAPEDGRNITEPVWRQFIATYTEAVFRYDGWQVARLRSNWTERPEVVLDAGTYDDMDPRIEYTGVWAGDRQFPDPANGTVTYSAHPGAFFRVRFRGQALAYVYTKAPNRGRAEVVIDGRSRAVVDLYSASTVWRQSTKIDGLGAGEHVLEVRVTGTRDPKAVEGWVDLDQLTILP